MVTEHGPSIGKHLGADIPSYIGFQMKPRHFLTPLPRGPLHGFADLLAVAVA